MERRPSFDELPSGTIPKPESGPGKIDYELEETLLPDELHPLDSSIALSKEEAETIKSLGFNSTDELLAEFAIDAHTKENEVWKRAVENATKEYDASLNSAEQADNPYHKRTVGLLQKDGESAAAYQARKERIEKQIADAREQAIVERVEKIMGIVDAVLSRAEHGNTLAAHEGVTQSTDDELDKLLSNYKPIDGKPLPGYTAGEKPEIKQ